MKLYLALLLSLSIGLSPAAYAVQAANNDSNPPIEAYSKTHEKDALAVMALIEKSQRLRSQLPAFVAESNKAIAEHNGALPAAYTLRLARALSGAAGMRNQLFDQALRHRSALYRTDSALTDKARLAKIVIGMAAAVTLYDNNKAMRDNFEDNTVLRNKLNEAYPEFGIPAGFYDSSVMRSANPEYRKAMADVIDYFNANKANIKAEIDLSEPQVQTLYAYVAQSPLLKKLRGGNVFKEIIILPVKAAKSTVNLSSRGLGKIKFKSSQVVGNSVGLVRWREGKLKDDAAMLKVLLSQLQPGDILLEKTPFALTDKSIPGHFGHAAIYTGTAKQLREMGALDLPLVQKNLTQINAGHNVVEALRNGVQLDTLQAFMNVDDVAILRPKYLSIDARREAVNLALGNLGKKYDFNFDVNTTETIVCSELVYIVYPQVDFITKRVLGSFAITPDDIALQAGTEADPLELILFAHDGKLVLDNTHDAGGLAMYNSLVKVAPSVAKATREPTAFDGFIKSY